MALRRRDNNFYSPNLRNTDSLTNRAPSLFDDNSWNDDWGVNNWDSMQNALKLDVREEDNFFEIIADVPGVPKENLNVDVKNNILTISAEKIKNSEQKGDHFTRIERSTGFTSRSFTLPENIESERISADLMNGVLRLNLPKKMVDNNLNRRKIAINSGLESGNSGKNIGYSGHSNLNSGVNSGLKSGNSGLNSGNSNFNSGFNRGV